jgi:hypothetical protein
LAQAIRKFTRDYLGRINLSDPQTNYFSLNEILNVSKITQLLNLEIQGRKVKTFGSGSRQRAAASINQTRIEQYQKQKELIQELGAQQAATAAAEEKQRRAATISIYDKQAQDIAKADDKNDLFKLAAIYAAISLLG